MKKFRMSLLAVLVVALFASSTVVGMAAEEKKKVEQPKGFPMTIELEKFDTIENGEVVKDKAASKKKAVLSSNLQFKASKKVKFATQGCYELTLIMNAPNGATDAINVNVHGNPARIYPDEKVAGTYTNCLRKIPIIVVDPNEELTITVFTTNEYGAKYDKVIIEYTEPL